MPETITRVRIDELSVVRVTTEDGVVGEMPLGMLSSYARDQRRIRQLSEEAEAILGRLQDALSAAQEMMAGRVEFVVKAN